MPQPQIRIETEIPGPRSLALMERRAAAVPRGPYQGLPVFMKSGHGALITDVDGNQYIDFAGGLGCLNVGSTPATVLEAVERQSGQFLHSCFHVLPYEPYIALAERLNGLVPISGEKKTLLVNSGAEGIENAVKCARAYTGRTGILVFEDGFHGRTLLTLSMTSKVEPFKKGFGPFMAEVHRVPYGYCYRCPYGKQRESCQIECGDVFESFFKRHVDPMTIAALVVEPVQGEGGFVVPPPEFLRALREVCDRYGIVMVADEVQAGIGRTGRMFACETFGVEPDILVSAKSLAGGLPLAAVTGRAAIMEAAPKGGLGSSYGGNPVACAAAIAVLDLVEREGLCARAEKIGSRVSSWAKELSQSVALIGDVRNAGAMIGIELVTDRETREPAREATAAVRKHCLEQGLLTLVAGNGANVLRLLMPLIITDEQLEEGLAVLSEGLRGARN